MLLATPEPGDVRRGSVWRAAEARRPPESAAQLAAVLGSPGWYNNQAGPHVEATDISMQRRQVLLALMALSLVLVLAACAAGANPEVGKAAAGGESAGFWLGLWHGIISPVTFVISLFNEKVSIYEVHNDGNWYDFGFVLGAGILFGGGFLGIGRNSKRQ